MQIDDMIFEEPRIAETFAALLASIGPIMHIGDVTIQEPFAFKYLVTAARAGKLLRVVHFKNMFLKKEGRNVWQIKRSNIY